MRRARITYPGAYHHVMNRGYDGNTIFAGSATKNHFLDYLEDAVTKMKIRIFAYCIMDNHYHMVLENSTGKMSDFLKEIAEIEIFNNLKFSSLRSMYRNMKKQR